ncbi:DUF397 domain-containing protein, partial [Streptomyces sp. TRM76130]|nr:DUF397 domain-containing protein [Streptomyces sp. TRM76130]
MTRTTASGLAWRKGSYSSGAETDSCVETATAAHAVHVRGSKHRPATGFRLALTPRAWVAFVTGLRDWTSRRHGDRTPAEAEEGRRRGASAHHDAGSPRLRWTR